MARTAVTNRFNVRDFGTALLFDGVDDKVLVGSASTYNGQSFTIATWLKPRGTGTRAFTGRAGGGPEIRVTSTNKIEFLDATVTSIGTSTGTVPNGQWSHCTVTYDGTDYALYINGALSGSGTNAHVMPFNGQLEIGACTGDLSFFNGLMDEFLVWQSVLTADDIQALYYRGRASATAGSFLLNEGAGTTANDSSGNGNHGTITGATYTSDVPSYERSAAVTRTVPSRTAV